VVVALFPSVFFTGLDILGPRIGHRTTINRHGFAASGREIERYAPAYRVAGGRCERETVAISAGSERIGLATPPSRKTPH